MKDGCPFCEYEGPSPLILDLDDVIVFEPMEPVAKGHVIVVPREHVAGFENPKLFARVSEVAAICAQSWYKEANIISSAGKVATQTVPHLHVHVIPRTANDGLVLPWGKLSHDHKPKPQPGTLEYDLWAANQIKTERMECSSTE